MVARRAHNPKVVGSNPAAATNVNTPFEAIQRAVFFAQILLRFRYISVTGMKTY